MKRIITFLLLILTTSAFSQGVDLDPHSFNVSYVNLPPKPVLDRKNRNFSITVNLYNAAEAKSAKEYLEENSGIDGFSRVASNGYLEIVFNLENSISNLQEVRKQVVFERNANGIEVPVTIYTNVFKCKDFGSYNVVCASEPSLNKKYSLERTYTKELSFRNQGESNSNSFLSSAVLRSSYLSNIVYNMESRLNHDYGYIVEQTSDYLWILDSKKHPEYESNVKALTSIKAIFNKMEYNQDVAPLKAELEPTIKYFEGLDKIYTEDERKHRKLRYEAYFNLAVIYHYLDMPDESDIWCAKLLANKYDASDAEGIKIKNESLREMFAVNQVKSRHMDVELRSNGIKNEDSDVINLDPNYFLKNDPKYKLISLILTTNDTVSGYSRINALGNLDRKVSVSIPDENGNHNHIFKTYFADQVTRLTIQENDFYSTVSFKEALRAGSKPVFRFVREILNGKTISLYGYQNNEIIIKKKEDAFGASTSSVGWQMNTKSKFAELARPCPKLAARTNGTEFQNDLNSFMKFVEALDACK